LRRGFFLATASAPVVLAGRVALGLVVLAALGRPVVLGGRLAHGLGLGAAPGQLQLGPILEEVAAEAVALLEVVDGAAVGLGDLVERITGLDHIDPGAGVGGRGPEQTHPQQDSPHALLPVG
jgi:hypothetical protein